MGDNIKSESQIEPLYAVLPCDGTSVLLTAFMTGATPKDRTQLFPCRMLKRSGGNAVDIRD
jgi:hypothetical protein